MLATSWAESTVGEKEDKCSIITVPQKKLSWANSDYDEGLHAARQNKTHPDTCSHSNASIH